MLQLNRMKNSNSLSLYADLPFNKKILVTVCLIHPDQAYWQAVSSKFLIFLKKTFHLAKILPKKILFCPNFPQLQETTLKDYLFSSISIN